jgi:polyhydroxyalkanoate synthase
MSSVPDPNAALQAMLQAGQAMAQGFSTIMAKQQEMLQQGLQQNAAMPPGIQPLQQSEELTALQKNWAARQAELWQKMIAKSSNSTPVSAEQTSVSDRRFDGPAWAESPVFDYLRQSYLINAEYLKQAAEFTPANDELARNRLRFMTRQFIDAMAPSNFAATNPEFIKTAVDTKGESITQGLQNLIGDLDKGYISMTDESAFEVGRNLATTPGSVVFENELIQLIQYSPSTENVAKRPFLMVPPCINKYYILDLQPENSFVRYAVDQGQTVFLVSWRNVQADLGHLTWDDYLEKGPLTAIRVVQEICGVEKINALGFCVGGTLLSSALAVAKARGENPVASLTLLTTLLEFSETGELGYFIDEASVQAREKTIGNGGLLRGSELSSVFSALRANDLIWQYVVGNYLKGNKPAAFDLLYWNADSTNLPGPFLAWYLRNLYLENNLRVPGKLNMCGVQADLRKIDMPVFFYASREDHIVPWKSSYLGRDLVTGETTFVLGASGHIAGVINPAAKNKRNYWINEKDHGQAVTAEQWFESAEEVKGSWWPRWSEWLGHFADGQIKARRKLGSKSHVAGEAAPGRYVKEKA